MNHLRRELAPISSHAFELIEAQVRDALKTYLSARKLVDFDGPHGFQFAAINLGRTREVTVSSDAGAITSVRQVQPMLEARVPFVLSLRELDDVDRGSDDPDLDAAVEAARRLARIEDRAVFYGADAAQIEGIVPRSSHQPIPLSPNFENFPGLVSLAIERLREQGVGGPYAIALDAPAYAALMRATEGGYPVLQHIRHLIDGPTIWAPALDGAVVLSTRGGDFELVVGEDISIGYQSHDLNNVTLYLEESFTFRLRSPEAAVSLPLPAI